MIAKCPIEAFESIFNQLDNKHILYGEPGKNKARQHDSEQSQYKYIISNHFGHYQTNWDCYVDSERNGKKISTGICEVIGITTDSPVVDTQQSIYQFNSGFLTESDYQPDTKEKKIPKYRFYFFNDHRQVRLLRVIHFF